jgi:hypothetical protein
LAILLEGLTTMADDETGILLALALLEIMMLLDTLALLYTATGLLEAFTLLETAAALLEAFALLDAMTTLLDGAALLEAIAETGPSTKISF